MDCHPPTHPSTWPPTSPPTHRPTVPTHFERLSASLGPAVSALCARLVSALCALCSALSLFTSDIDAVNLGDAACISRNTFKRPAALSGGLCPTSFDLRRAASCDLHLGASFCSCLLTIGSRMAGDIDRTVARTFHRCTQHQSDGYR